MIPIKEHNDIVGQLMKEIGNKQSEIKAIQKQKSKGVPQVPQLEPTANEQMLNKKINQLNKEYKERISNLTQQLRSKSVEAKDLKERLAVKNNIEAKQKEHIAEIMKKTYDRKPASNADYKISALITHYQAEITKKVKFIELLQKQIRQFETTPTRLSESDIENENYKQAANQESPKGITLVEHQKQIGKVKVEMQKYRKLYEQKEKEYKNLARRYSELTNEYYKVINSYGIEEPKKNSDKGSKTQIKNQQHLFKGKKTIQNKLKTNALHNLLQQMVCSQSQIQESNFGKTKKTNQTSQRGSKTNSNGFEDDEQLLSPRGRPSPYQQNDIAVAKLQEILEFTNLQDPNDIIAELTKNKVKLQEYDLVDTVARSLQAFFYNIGKGKMTKQELVEGLQDLEESYNRNLQAVDQLDQICIQVGAKRDKLHQKLAQLLKVKQEYYSQLKNLKFTQQMARGNKIIQFIQFFQLDKEQLALPQQLINIQQQLKAINKFIKQIRVILEIDAQKSSQMVLQLVLRYIQKASTLVSQYQKKINKPKPTQI